MEIEKTLPSLDDLYHMVSHIYSDKNAERPISVTFSHFVEVCGMLTMHSKKKNREEVNMESALCKALGWYFPLMAKLKVKSIQELIFRKYPAVCPYCRLSPHEEVKCKQTLGTAATVDHEKLRSKYEENKSKMPHSLNEWQEMFAKIYPRRLETKPWTVMSLLEELGEFAEALRIFDTHPKYVAGEAADIFSYLMGIANEYNIKLMTESQVPFDFEKEFITRYPGLCPQCGYQVCVCPVIPEATVGRMAKELDLFPHDDIFSLDMRTNETLGIEVSNRIIDNFGGLIEYAKKFPFDRGDTNRALVSICLKLSSHLTERKPSLAKQMNEIALKISKNSKRAGVKAEENGLEEIIQTLTNVLPEVDVTSFKDENSLSKMMIKELQAKACRFGIITALPKEFAAMKIMLEDSFEYNISNDNSTYIIGRIPCNGGSGHNLVALALMKQYGNNNAAITTSNLQRSFPGISDIIMLGIAGGIPDYDHYNKHVRLGDIVISMGSGVVQYDNLKKEVEKITIRDNSPKPSAFLVDIVNQIEADRIQGKYPWEKFISENFSKIENGDRPSDEKDLLFKYNDVANPIKVEHPSDETRLLHKSKIHYGIIGAANILLKDPHLRDQLKRDCNVIAIEMEGSGVADSSWFAGNNYLIVRGISDYCDPQKNDLWQGHAAICAAAYTRCLLEKIPALIDSKSNLR